MWYSLQNSLLIEASGPGGCPAATRASVPPGPLREFYQRSLAKGIKPTMVRLTLARKIAAITLTVWKKGENFDADKLKSQAA